MKTATLISWILALLFLGAWSAVVLPIGNQHALLQPLTVAGYSFPLINGVVGLMVFTTTLPAAYLSYLYLGLVRQMRGVKRGNRRELRAGEQLVHARGLLAHQHYQAALDLVGDDDGLEAVLIRAEALFGQGELEAAAALLQPCFAETGDARIGYLLVDIRECLQRSPIDVLDALIEADSAHARAALKRAATYYENEAAWDLALAVVDQLEKIGLDDCSRQRMLYHFKQVQSSTDEQSSRKHLERLQSFTKKDATFLPAWLEQGRVWWAAGNLEKAQQALQKGYEATHHLACLDLQVEFLLEDSRPEDAIQVYLAHADDKPAVRFQLAKLYQRLLMLDEALDQFEILDGIIPQLAAPARYRAQIKARRHRYEEAAADFNQFLEEHQPPFTDYLCQTCRAPSAERRERCDACGAWDSVVLEAETLKFELATTVGPRYHGA